MKNKIKYYYPVEANDVFTNEIVYFVYPLNEKKRLDKDFFSNLRLSIIKFCRCDNLPSAKRAIAEWKEERAWKEEKNRF